MIKASFRPILAALTATVALVSCSKETIRDDVTVTPASSIAGKERVIAVSFGARTKTYLDGLTPKFTGVDSILISNGTALDTCKVEGEGDDATISTLLEGPLTAVYPYWAAKVEGTGISDEVYIPATQSGKFADANICMAKMSGPDETGLSFENKTAVLRFYVDRSIGIKSIKIISGGSDPIPDIAVDTAGTGSEIVVDAGDELKTLDKITDDPGKRICYVAVKPGTFHILDLEIGTQTQTANTDAVVNSQLLDVTLVVNTIYNVFIPYYIDLGDAGKWAYCNVGAFLPEEPGDYFMWGEVSGHKYVSGVWTNFPTLNPDADRYTGGWNASSGFAQCNAPYWDGSSYSKYPDTDNDLSLWDMDDAAYKNWEGGWRMPTEDDFEALLERSRQWNGTKKGYDFYMEADTVFFPITGFGSGNQLSFETDYGLYWSRSLIEQALLDPDSTRAQTLLFVNPKANAISDIPGIFDNLGSTNSSELDIADIYRFYGCTVRPIYVGVAIED